MKNTYHRRLIHVLHLFCTLFLAVHNIKIHRAPNYTDNGPANGIQLQTNNKDLPSIQSIKQSAIDTYEIRCIACV